MSNIDTVLGRLKSRIRTYVWIEGLALVVCLVCLIFWLAYGLDVLYFGVRRLELPRWFRVGYLFLAIAAVGAAIVTLFVFRLVRSFRAKALALVLERRFPNLDDRLVTAVEMSEAPPSRQTPLHRAMLERTVANVSRDAGELDLGDVFSKAPIRRATIAAVVLALVTGLFFATNAEAVDRVRRGFLGLDEIYWDRDTLLKVKVVTQPGDRLRDFRDADGNATDGLPGTHKHPRGSDLVLLVYVPEGRNHEGIDWVIPDEDDVVVRYRRDRGGSGSGRVTRRDDPALLERLGARAVFEFSKADVSADTDVWVSGNDYLNRRPYAIEAVDPPRLDAITLHCDFPEHVPSVASERVKRVARRSQELPEETRFLFDATANKPIVGARLEFGGSELVIEPTVDANGNDGPPRAVYSTRSEDGSEQTETVVPPEIAARFVRADGSGLRVPFVVSRLQTKAARDRAAGDFAIDAGGSGGRATDFGTPFVVASGTRLRVYLTDTDGISTIEPSQLVVDAREDTKPEFVDLRLRAIGTVDGKITRKARIPFEGRIVDDHGLVKSRFEFRIDRRESRSADGEGDDTGTDGKPAPEPEVPAAPSEFDIGPAYRVRPLANPPEGYPADFRLAEAEDLPFERFDVLPLELKVGNRLFLVLYAEDGDELNGPHESRTVEYEFEIVSESDLQASLYPREMDLLEQLKQVVDEIKTARRELESAEAPEAGQRARAIERDRLLGDADRDEQRFAEADRQLEGAARYGISRVRTSRGECEAVESAFVEIREELLNNGFPDRLVQRMQEAILDPLHRANTEHFPALDRSLGAFRVGIEDGTPVVPHVDNAILEADDLVAELEKVVAELEDRVGYLKAIAELKAIYEQELELRDRTKKAQVESAIGDLEKLQGLDD